MPHDKLLYFNNWWALLPLPLLIRAKVPPRRDITSRCLILPMITLLRQIVTFSLVSKLPSQFWRIVSMCRTFHFYCTVTFFFFPHLIICAHYLLFVMIETWKFWLCCLSVEITFLKPFLITIFSRNFQVGLSYENNES